MIIQAHHPEVRIEYNKLIPPVTDESYPIMLHLEAVDVTEEWIPDILYLEKVPMMIHPDDSLDYDPNVILWEYHLVLSKDVKSTEEIRIIFRNKSVAKGVIKAIRNPDMDLFKDFPEVFL